MSELSRVLDKIREEIAKHRGKRISEENTKTALINPVLCALGWNVGNLDEVSQEFKLESSHDPVDYALLLAARPKLMLEAKALGESLAGGKWANQIMGYAATAGVTWVIITNGDEYRIYNATVPVPFEQKLFRTVRLSNPADPTEETLALLSKARIDDIDAQWQVQYADSRVLAAVHKFFSPVPHRSLLAFVKKQVKKEAGLTLKQLRESLSRVCMLLTFSDGKVLNDDGASCTSDKAAEGSGNKYVEFWQPIRTEPNGLFAGKPCGEAWISKGVRLMGVVLVVRDHSCRVDIGFDTNDKIQRRERVSTLIKERLPQLAAHCGYKDNPKWVNIRIPVLDKGIEDRHNWPEIRQELKQRGEEIYRVLEKSDV